MDLEIGIHHSEAAPRVLQHVLRVRRQRANCQDGKPPGIDCKLDDGARGEALTPSLLTEGAQNAIAACAMFLP